MSSSKKKKVVSKVAPVAPELTAPAAVASVNPIPTTVSAPPDGWVEPERLGRKGRRPKTGLTLVAPDLVAELRTSAPALLTELGTNAVDPQQLAAALDTAHAWTGVAAKATAFNTYARSQRGTSWDAAMKLMNGMQLGVRYALARDGTFADCFPEVAKAFAPKPRPKKFDDRRGHDGGPEDHLAEEVRERVHGADGVHRDAGCARSAGTAGSTRSSGGHCVTPAEHPPSARSSDARGRGGAISASSAPPHPAPSAPARTTSAPSPPPATACAAASRPPA